MVSLVRAASDWRAGPGGGGACASGCIDEPAVSAAPAGWAAVASAKRGQTTGSGLDPPLGPAVPMYTP